MHLQPIRTRIFNPPKDDIYPELKLRLSEIRGGDIVLITSKIVSIHEGRCVPIDKYRKQDLIEKESEYIYKIPETGKLITITKNAIISGSGIDKSNGQGHLILLPQDSYASARELHNFLIRTFDLNKIGVIITDSHSMPLRYGAQSISIGSWGLEPIEYHANKKDLFGRELRHSKTNIVDSLAAAATLVSGECAESTPVVIARDIPNITFTNKDMRKELCVEMEEDLYRSLFKEFKKGGKKK